MIPRDIIEKVIESADIVDFVGERVDLKRAGVNMKGRCPFHDEKTPSFIVSPAKQLFKCFGCGVAGDVIKFIMEFEGLNYPEAIRLVGAKVGIEIVEEYSSYDKEAHQAKESKKEQLISVLNRAANFYFEQFLKYKDSNSLVREFIEKREIDDKTASTYKIGYAPEGWQTLTENKIFDNREKDLLVEAGLLRNRDGRTYDYFRERIMFPVFDIMGNVIAFSARAIKEGDEPKYLNSPESDVYKKNKVLFGFFQAKEAVRKSREIVVCEGNLDQITLFKNGIENVVALCGTGFTEEHAKLIKRNADKVYIMFDGDNAGIKSAIKSSEILLQKDIENYIVHLPFDDDPDSYLKTYGKHETEKLIKHAKNFVDYRLAVNPPLDTSEMKINFVRKIAETFALIADPVKKQVYIDQVSEATDISKTVILEEIDNVSKNKRRPRSKKEAEDKREINFIFKSEYDAEFRLVYILATEENVRSWVLHDITEDYIISDEAKKLYSIIYEAHEDGEELSFQKFLARIEDEDIKDFFINFVTKEELSEQSEEKTEFQLRQVIKKMKLDKINREIEYIKKELAMGSSNTEELFMRSHELSILKTEIEKNN